MLRKKLSIIAFALAVVVLASCNSSTNEKEPESDSTAIGGTAFRSGDLMSEDFELGDMATVDANAPGTGTTMDRAFENAPPMIPHSVEGFLPITIKNNMCMTCHMPNVAVSMNSTPIPASHFTDYRPEISQKNGKYHLYEQNEVTAKDLKEKLNSARYNCSQCHVPQTNVTVVLKNEFQADFRNENDSKTSNLHENINEGVK